MRRSAFLACGVAAAIWVAGCASTVAGSPAALPQPVGPTSPSSSSSTTSSAATDVTDPTAATRTTVTDPSEFASGVTFEEFDQDLVDAEFVVNEYWVVHWSDFYTGTYQPPTVVGLYDGTDPSTAPTCDGEPLEATNAFYCRDEDYVAWDVGLMADGTDLIGDTWIYLVIAHEWGHAIQNRLDLGLVADGRELQADCLGAAALFGAVADGTLELEEGDEKEMVNSLSLLADETAWTSSSDHGDPFERVQWFTLGRNGGVPACHQVLVDENAATTDVTVTTAATTGESVRTDSPAPDGGPTVPDTTLPDTTVPDTTAAAPTG